MKITIYVLLFLFLAAQLIQVEKINPVSDPALEIETSKEIKDILKKACYDCHSNETKWPWYSKIAPLSWSIKDHVEHGRAWVNYSIWNSYSKEDQKKKLKETFRAMYVAMPPTDYISFHKEADLTKEERNLVRNWIKSLKLDQ